VASLSQYTGARLYPDPGQMVVPGEPDQSLLVWAIVDTLMPPLGVWTADPEGLEILRAWISAWPE